MMKKKICSPLLLLLLVVTTRNSSAVLNTSQDGVTDETPTDSTSPTVNAEAANNMTEVVELLANLFTGLQDKMPSIQHFGITIDNLEKDISRLPSDIAVNRRDILFLLYRSKDKFNEARSVLDYAANVLIRYCLSLITEIDYIGNIDTIGYSEISLKYIARQAARYINTANLSMKRVLSSIKEIREMFLNSKDMIEEFTTTLNSNAVKINEINENEKKYLQITETWIKSLEPQNIDNLIPTHDKIESCLEMIDQLCIEVIIPRDGNSVNISIYIVIPAEIVIHYSKTPVDFGQNSQSKFSPQLKQSNIKRNENLPLKVKEAQNSMSTLLSLVDKMKEYLANENEMITKRLTSTYEYNFDDVNISTKEISSKFKSLKDIIVVLKNACESFVGY